MQLSGGRIPDRGMTKGQEPEMVTGEVMRAPLAGWRSSEEARKAGAGGRDEWEEPRPDEMQRTGWVYRAR